MEWAQGTACGVRGRQKTLRRTRGHMSAHAGGLAYEVTHLIHCFYCLRAMRNEILSAKERRRLTVEGLGGKGVGVIILSTGQAKSQRTGGNDGAKICLHQRKATTVGGFAQLLFVRYLGEDLGQAGYSADRSQRRRNVCSCHQ